MFAEPHAHQKREFQARRVGGDASNQNKGNASLANQHPPSAARDARRHTAFASDFMHQGVLHGVQHVIALLQPPAKTSTLNNSSPTISAVVAMLMQPSFLHLRVVVIVEVRTFVHQYNARSHPMMPSSRRIPPSSHGAFSFIRASSSAGPHQEKSERKKEPIYILHAPPS